MLLIVLDTVRAQSLSLYGYHRPTTPWLERWAKKGVLFERAIAPAPWTLPTHASMFTGRWHHELSVGWGTPLDDTYPTLAEVLSAQGYATAGFVANFSYCTREHGLNRGFARYEDFPVSPGQFALSSSLGRTIATSDRLRNILDCHELFNRKTAAVINRDFLRWLSRRNRRPFFAFLNYYDAHTPYLPPHPYEVMFGPKRPRGEFRHTLVTAEHVDRWKMTPKEVQVELDAYEGAIAYVDHQLGLLFDELEKRGALENTLVIVTSDHGEEFGEHGVFGHDNSLYLPSLYVPLVIVFPPRVPVGESVPVPVSLRDLPATVLDLIGLGDGTRFPGHSLAGTWERMDGQDGLGTGFMLSELNVGSLSQEWYPIAKGNMKSLVVDRHHYILNGDDREELYDIANDPWETRDLADSDEGRRLLDTLRAILQITLAS